MGLLDKSTELLKESLIKGNKPFTYKLLSRELNIHTSDAKALLYSFYLKFKDEVEPTYLLLGQLQDSDDLLSIKLTKNLGDQDEFEKLASIEVYALAPKNLTIDEIVQSNVSEVERFPLTQDGFKQWGVIRGPEFIEVETIHTETTHPIRQEVRKPINKTKEETSNSKASKFDTGLASARILEKYKTKEKPIKKDQPSISTTFTSKTTSSSNTMKPGVTRRSKTEPVNGGPAELIEDEDLNDEEFIKKQELEKQEKDRKRKELESMFDDDDGFEVYERKGEVQPDKPQPVTASKHADLEGIFDSSFSASQSQSQSQSQQGNSSVKSSPAKTNERKEVSKEVSKEASDSVTSYYDEDGYLVTKVEAKQKSAPNPKPRARTATSSLESKSPAKKAKSGTKQSTLMSFFGKKK
ncbi:DNA polymerase delta subunit POL32 CYBJADRAFT_186058 [Cyberlindnera jadinii NRRL Y-1542]|uniref:DNA polymerase delta subunit 3 n=1 Tax=Cyberlindnera jadinii (strain ATCC 18201 / CBS 1600 / BCRC 20928 / JCM 3617 / NBRC 0987 / NRRL Y-1542) TaxID=983966 RepID=A0A1E4RY32_CYBJN|nr:hypothetical protein CYBJADRAFT_186058 [Cyberlindnera jadinii NRRL Y-1542]ODV72192.1 hypothetical protein CYBJADRAFT_186058 [Cyberlindnera jadinii NRRL Y-1542]